MRRARLRGHRRFRPMGAARRPVARRRYPRRVPDDNSADPYRLPRTVVPSRYDLTLRPDLDARDLHRQRPHRGGRRGAHGHGRAQRRLTSGSTRRWSWPATPATPLVPSWTSRPSGSTSTSTSPWRRAMPSSSWPSPACSTTSSRASTAAPSPTRAATSGSWPRPSSRPPTPDGPFPAGTSRSSRPASPSPSRSPTTCWRCPTPARWPVNRSRTAGSGSTSPRPWSCRPTWSPSWSVPSR